MPELLHVHTTAELDPAAWTLDGLLLHPSEGHGMLFGACGKEVPQMAAIHGGEHREARAGD